MTDNQDSKIKVGAQTPPTDRPLTAGDVPLLREGYVIQCRDRGQTKTHEVRSISSALGGIYVDGGGMYAPYLCTFVSRPATSAASEVVDIDGLCAALLDGVGCTPWASSSWDTDGTDGASREGVRESVLRVLAAAAPLSSASDAGCTSVPVKGQCFRSEQDWINRASRALTRHPDYNNTEHGDAKGWRGPHFTALCFDQAGNRMRNGADFKRATQENTYPVWWIWPDQIVPALASPPVSERERELEGALGLIADGWGVIESSGSMGEMTLQAPDDWEGDQTEIVVKFHGLTAQPAGEGK